MTYCINAADKLTAMLTVPSIDFLWLNLISMSIVNCSRVSKMESMHWDGLLPISVDMGGPIQLI